MYNLSQADEVLYVVFSTEPGYIQKCYKSSGKDPLNRYLEHTSRKPTSNVERYKLIRSAWNHYCSWLKSEGRLDKLAEVNANSQVKCALEVLKGNGY